MRWILSKLATAGKQFLQSERFNQERGRIISLWASVETSIDLANNYAWEYSDRKISRVVPINLRWKLELFERIHTELIPFQGLRIQAKEIVESVKALQDDRHWLVHGFLEPHAKEPGCWRVKKGVLQPDGGMAFPIRRLTVEELETIRNDMLKLTPKVASYVLALLFEMRKHHKDDLGG